MAFTWNKSTTSSSSTNLIKQATSVQFHPLQPPRSSQSSMTVLPPKNHLAEFEKLWNDFDAFYLQIICDNHKVIKEAKRKYKSLLLVPQITHNLSQMIKLLKQEDEVHRSQKTVGDCLEFLLRSKLSEVLCAYAMIDKPRGFFKLALSTLTELFNSVQSISLLGQVSVHPGVSQLLRCIYRNLSAWKYLPGTGEPDLHQIAELEPYIYDSTAEIVEFIGAIAKKVQEEPYLVKVFFSGQSDIINGESSERICLPFQILVLYFKHQQKLLSSSEKVLLRSVLLRCLNCMSRDQTFSDYLSNESDFIDIFMQLLSSQMENLPTPLTYSPTDGFHITQQLKNNYNEIIVEQFREFVDACFFLKEILVRVYNDEQHHQIVTNDFHGDAEQERYEIQVKESFQISFFQLILCSIVQPVIFEGLQLDKIRTMLQYLIETLVVLSDKSIARLTFAFLFNRMDALRSQYETPMQYQSHHLRESLLESVVEQESQLSQSQQQEEDPLPVEYDTKKHFKLNFEGMKKQSFDATQAKVPQSFSPRRLKQRSIMNESELHSLKSSFTLSSCQQTKTQPQPQEVMTLMRLKRIDNLLKEAEDIQDVESEIDTGHHFSQKMEKSLQFYEGERIRLLTLNILVNEQEGLNIVHLQLIQSVIQVLGIKEFYRDFIMDEIMITNVENYTVNYLQAHIPSVVPCLSETDYTKVFNLLSQSKTIQISEIVEEVQSNDLEHLTKFENYTVECKNELILSLFKLLDSFFQNSPNHNILLVVSYDQLISQDILLQLLDDSDNMLSEQDTFYFTSFLLQNHQDSLLFILEKLKRQAQSREQDETIKLLKQEILRSFELQAEDSGNFNYTNHLKEPNILIAENIIILESLYHQFQRFIAHHYLAFQLISQQLEVQEEEQNIMNMKNEFENRMKQESSGSRMRESATS